ncbi:MAG: chorismate synthase [Candidatus Muiribacteriota bacterium]
MIDFYTAGESHGPELTTIITGFPAQVYISREYIDFELSRRQKGYGRGKRMQIEKDRIKITAGLDRYNKTTGAPVSFSIQNKDYKNWKNKNEKIITAPRPGHADLYGALRHNHDNLRNVIERASARESACRVAAGGFFKQLLLRENIKIFSFVIGIKDREFYKNKFDINPEEMDFVSKSDCLALDLKTEEIIKKEVDEAEKKKDSLGGRVRVIVKGLKAGTGSYSDFRERLDSQLAGALISIPSVKGINFGNLEYSYGYGSSYHDEIINIDNNKIKHSSNNSGGINGGISTGENIYFDLFIKPVPTLRKPLDTVDIKTKKRCEALKERSDIWVCPAIGVIAEAMTSYVLLRQ